MAKKYILQKAEIILALYGIIWLLLLIGGIDSMT